jgi:hypothetical protein
MIYELLCVVLCLLGAFVTLRKSRVNYVISVRLERFGSHWTDFHENLLRDFKFH